LKIGNKYKPSVPEKQEQGIVAEYAAADEAFSNQCCVLIICAHFRIIDEKKLLRTWDEVTITRHLKKHLQRCITEEELRYFVVPEYPEDDEDIDDGLKDASKEVFFDLVFSSFFNKQHYFGVEAKIVIENNFLKRRATTELAEYISDKGMKKFINGVYKKRGCMIGYVMEGDLPTIANKINDRIKADTFYSGDACLKKKLLVKYFDSYFESIHIGYHANPLKHLFLDFSQV
jgi:hypothetical protein